MDTEVKAKLPEGFLDLVQAREAKDHTAVNIIGVVVDVLPRTLARNGRVGVDGPNWMLTFKILDRALAESSDGFAGLSVRFFRGEKVLDSMPNVENIGDVVLLRGIRMTTFNGQRFAVSSSRKEVDFLTFPAASVPHPNFMISILGGKQKLNGEGTPAQLEALTLAEQAYIVKLKHDLDDRLTALTGTSYYQITPTAPVPNAPTGPKRDTRLLERSGQTSLSLPPAKRQRMYGPFGPKFKLIEELKYPPDWADICVQVVKAFPTNYGGFDLYVTDYTSNDKVRYYTPPEKSAEDEYGREGDLYGYAGAPTKQWPGPWEHLVLKVNVKEPHARFIHDYVKVGDWVLLQNVKMRLAPDGKLEGDMWPDYKDQDRIQVQKVRPDYVDISTALSRASKYWDAREALTGDSKAKDQDQNEQPLSKRGKKRLKKQQNSANKAKTKNDDTNTYDRPTPKGEVPRAHELNKNVRCSNENVPLSTIREILDPEDSRHSDYRKNGGLGALPFINAKYRARVRVVDFAPRRLEDFARKVDLSADEAASIDPDSSYPATSRWEWHFALCLENVTTSANTSAVDADRLWVQVHHNDAQFLLGNAVNDPENLYHNQELLTQLRERLFLLWGNLEEEGGPSEKVSNRPFVCCIMEYGIEVVESDRLPQPARRYDAGWKRMFAMFGVTIQ